MSVFHTNALAGASGRQGAGGGAAQYQISRSIRLNAPDSAYLSRTPASAGNRKTWTWSGWVKRSGLSVRQNIFGNTDSSFYNGFWVEFYSDDKLRIGDIGSSSLDYDIITSQVFRDCSSWGHLVVAVDTTQATASNRVSIYWNGVQITSFSGATYPTLNFDTRLNTATAHSLGRAGAYNAQYLSGYLTDIHFIDGQALTPSSFGETDATTGEWIPKAYTGTYGTNGFKLNFSNNSAATATTLGADSSGNGNNWTPNNLQALAGGPYSIAVATGAVPIQNTTDTYGSTIGTGVRSDANASSLVLAAPLTTAGGNTLSDDKQPSGRTSSTKTLTATGTVTSDTSVFKYYGGSASFSASSYYSLNSTDFTFGTGDFTIEAWVYNPTGTSGSMFSTALNSLANTTVNSRFSSTGSVDVYTSGGGDFISIASVPLNQWVHVAMVRSGTAMNVFINGELKGTGTWGMNLADSGNFYINTGRDGSGARRYQDVRVYKGLAKYSGGFSVPTPTQNTTVAAQCDSLVDTPTSYGTDTGVGGEVRGNYCTLNPLAIGANSSQITYANGNLEATWATTGTYATTLGTVGVSSGKWYWESTITATSNLLGVATASSSLTNYVGAEATSYGYYSLDGQKYNNAVGSAYGNTFTTNDVIGIALDLDNGRLFFSKNGVWQNSGNPTGGTGAAFTGLSGTFFPAYSEGAGSAAASYACNFGQRPFAYTAPSGFKALCDTNLPAPTIVKPSTVMDVALWTGNGSARSITGIGFSPDLAWIKARSVAYGHRLFDTIRGATKTLVTNGTDAEATDAATLTAFNSDGFSVGTSANVNENTTTYAAWCWDAGSSTVTNNDGTVSSQVRANASAGFSIATFTTPATAGNLSVGHGLGVKPSMTILKARSGSDAWFTWHIGLGDNLTDYLILSGTAAKTSQGGMWGAVGRTSTVCGFASVVSTFASANYVMYNFAPVAGYSAFGSYTGNGSADGPFVFCNFRPRWVMIKRTDVAEQWVIQDTARDTYNVASKYVIANLSDAEGTSTIMDITSNGFKQRNTFTSNNASNGTYIYAAFAESPFQTSRAR